MSRTQYNVESEPRRRSSKRRRRRKKKNRLPVLIIVALILVLSLAAVAGAVLDRISPTKERADLQSLCGAEEGYAGVILNHSWYKEPALWENGHIYLNVNMVAEELHGRFFYDAADGIVLCTLPDETVRASSETMYDEAPVLIERGEEAFLQLEYAAQYTNVTYEVFRDPERVVLQGSWGSIETAEVKKDAAVRVKGGIKSPVITDLTPGQQVTILDVMENWTQVQTPDGWTGYVKNTDLGESQMVEETAPDREPVFPCLSVDHEICLVWQQSLNSSCIRQLQTLLGSAAMDSVNTVAPTWFSIQGSDGSFSDRASKEYADLAHQNGLDVWPVLDNVNAPDVNITELLMSTEARTRMIRGVMASLEKSGADGLNVDLEKIPEEAALGYIQLIRELSVACHARQLVLSVDNMVPSSWSGYYNRREQGIVADYVIIMAYDEHYSGSEPGSTASLDYVQQAIVDTCAEVPRNKVVCGIPFYSRLWKDEIAGISSEAIGMDGMQEFLSKYSAQPGWDDSLGQNYVRVEDGQTIYQLWIEDVRSCDTRLDMIRGQEIAGIACWKQGMQSEDVWSILAKYYG